MKKKLGALLLVFVLLAPGCAAIKGSMSEAGLTPISFGVELPMAGFGVGFDGGAVETNVHVDGAKAFGIVKNLAWGLAKKVLWGSVKSVFGMFSSGSSEGG